MATATTSSVNGDHVPTRLRSATNAVSSAASGLAGVAGSLAGVAGDAVSKLPDAATSSRIAIDDANRQLQGGSDDMLAVGTAMSFGLGAGLLLGGAHRVLVAVAMVPVAMMGLTLLGRASRARNGERGGLQGR